MLAFLFLSWLIAVWTGADYEVDYCDDYHDILQQRIDMKAIRSEVSGMRDKQPQDTVFKWTQTYTCRDAIAFLRAAAMQLLPGTALVFLSSA